MTRRVSHGGRTRWWLSAFAVVAAIAMNGASPPPDVPPIRFVPEMARIAELDESRPLEGRPGAPVEKALSDAWTACAGRVSRATTPERVRELSRWAKAQMAGYRRVPDLARLRFEPVARRPADGRLVFSVNADVLPTHSPLVTRWLQVYLVYDPAGKRIDSVVVTIRGERLE